MISEDRLILYFYRDGLAEMERQEIAAALNQDQELQQRYQQLSSELQALSQVDEVPAPGYMAQQWHTAISREAQLERQKQAPVAPQRKFFIWGLAASALLCLGVVIGTLIQPLPVAQRPQQAEALPLPDSSVEEVGARSAAFMRGMQYSLSDQHLGLDQLPPSSDESYQLLLMQIIAQNRLIERAAVANKAPELARLMRAFEPLLLKMADASTSPEDVAALRRQLTFELGAMLTKLQQTSSGSVTEI